MAWRFSLEKIPGSQATTLYTGRGAQDMGKTRRQPLKALVKAWACAFVANEAEKTRRSET
jgi:hypothetical protein